MGKFDPPSPFKDDGSTISPKASGRAFSLGGVVSEVGVEYPVWEKKDSNGDVVASMTVECSDLTDGAQVCQIHFWVMSDTPGTLTKEFTIDATTD